VKRYETKAITVSPGAVVQGLDHYGDQGWHVVAGFRDDDDYYRFILQRLKEQDA
jgi:hypothetical protein